MESMESMPPFAVRLEVPMSDNWVDDALCKLIAAFIIVISFPIGPAIALYLYLYKKHRDRKLNPPPPKPKSRAQLAQELQTQMQEEMIGARSFYKNDQEYAEVCRHIENRYIQLYHELMSRMKV